MPRSLWIGRNLAEGAPAGDAGWFFVEHVVFMEQPGLAVTFLEEEPVVGFLSFALLHPHEHPCPAKFLTVDNELQLSLGVIFLRVPAGAPRALIPEQHSAAAVFVLGNDPLEIAVFE